MYELLDIIWPLVKKRPLSDSDNNSIYRVSESKFWKSFHFTPNNIWDHQLEQTSNIYRLNRDRY